MDTLRYWIDNLFARGTKALLLVLSGSVVVLIGLLTIVLITFNVSVGPRATFLDEVWTIFMFTFDPSGVPYTDGNWAYRFLMLAASLSGIFVLSLLVGILTTGFSDAIHTLRKGKSIVVEEGHTLILGWGEQIFSVLNQLLLANENQSTACIVILADVDKVEMESAIRSRVRRTGRTRIVCRSGSPTDLADLEIVKPELAKSIIVLDVPTTSADESDILTIKILLALGRFANASRRPSIVATIRNEDSLHAAELASQGVSFIVPCELIISQIITQTARQPGLSLVYSEILAFEGNEFYTTMVKGLSGRPFSSIQLEFETSTVVGIKHTDGRVLINPPMDTVLGENDALIVLAEDDDMIKLRSVGQDPAPIDESLMRLTASEMHIAEQILILGWSERLPNILSELSAYVDEQAVIRVVDPEDQHANVERAREQYPTLSIEFTQGSPTQRATLDTLHVETFTSIIVLADPSRGVQESDARTLMTLIHLRDILEQTGTSQLVNIVTEMLDERNRSLAAMDAVDDFIISSTLVSLLLTQISENRDLYEVFKELFNATGSEIYLKPLTAYVTIDGPISFATITAAASKRSEIAIGIKRWNDGQWDIRLNIPKSEMFTLTTADRVIVIAED